MFELRLLRRDKPLWKGRSRDVTSLFELEADQARRGERGLSLLEVMVVLLVFALNSLSTMEQQVFASSPNPSSLRRHGKNADSYFQEVCSFFFFAHPIITAATLLLPDKGLALLALSTILL